MQSAPEVRQLLQNKVLYGHVKETCCLRAQPRFDSIHQINIVEAP